MSEYRSDLGKGTMGERLVRSEFKCSQCERSSVYLVVGDQAVPKCAYCGRQLANLEMTSSREEPPHDGIVRTL